MNFYNSIYKISFVKESFSQLLEYFKILYIFFGKIQFNCPYLKHYRKKILNFVEYFDIRNYFSNRKYSLKKQIDDLIFIYLLHCFKINFLKLFRIVLVS